MKKTYIFLSTLVTASFLISCGGESSSEKQPFTTDDVKANSAMSGESIYKRACASCHMAGGDGIPNVYPPLAKSDYLADKERAIHQVIHGSSGKIIVNGKEYNNTMPPQQLNDEEIAAVLSYVYANEIMGNGGTAVTTEEVKAVRAKQ
jgi:nitrite reductase (NO-forming)